LALVKLGLLHDVPLNALAISDEIIAEFEAWHFPYLTLFPR
jgi:hypothetical protein